jgi:hypothetical protein
MHDITSGDGWIILENLSPLLQRHSVACATLKPASESAFKHGCGHRSATGGALRTAP